MPDSQRVLHPRTMHSLSCVLTHALYLWWVTGWKALLCNPAWVRGSMRMRPCKACLLAHASPFPQHHFLYDCGSSCKVPGLRCATATKRKDVSLCRCEQWVSGRLPHPQRCLCGQCCLMSHTFERPTCADMFMEHAWHAQVQGQWWARCTHTHCTRVHVRVHVHVFECHTAA